MPRDPRPRGESWRGKDQQWLTLDLLGKFHQHAERACRGVWLRAFCPFDRYVLGIDVGRFAVGVKLQSAAEIAGHFIALARIADRFERFHLGHTAAQAEDQPTRQFRLRDGLGKFVRPERPTLQVDGRKNAQTKEDPQQALGFGRVERPTVGQAVEKAVVDAQRAEHLTGRFRLLLFAGPRRRRERQTGCHACSKTEHAAQPPRRYT